MYSLFIPIIILLVLSNLIFKIAIFLVTEIFDTYYKYDDLTIKFYLPKSKKEKNKIDFYYKLTELDEYDHLIYKRNNYKIKKYNYEYSDNLVINFILIFTFLIPIKFFKYKYVYEDSFIIEVKDLSTLTYEMIGNIYEEKKLKVLIAYNNDKLSKENIDNQLNRINNKL